MRKPFWEEFQRLPVREVTDRVQSCVVIEKQAIRSYNATLANITEKYGTMALVLADLHELTMMALFKANSTPIYKIAREFGEELAKVDLNISPDLIRESLPYFIEFPESIRFEDGGDFFHCAMITVAKSQPGAGLITSPNPNKLFLEPGDPTEDVDTAISILMPCYNENGIYTMQSNFLTLGFRTKDESIESSLTRAKKMSTHPINNMDLVKFIIKCMVYIESGEPDLRQYRAPKPTTDNPKKLRRWFKDHENKSLVDMTLVGFNFKKPAVYTVDEVKVSGHFRWQPWGTGRTKVKLIWIDPFVRHYKTAEERTDK